MSLPAKCLQYFQSSPSALGQQRIRDAFKMTTLPQSGFELGATAVPTQLLSVTFSRYNQTVAHPLPSLIIKTTDPRATQVLVMEIKEPRATHRQHRDDRT